MNKNNFIVSILSVVCFLFLVVLWGKMNRLEQRIDFLASNFSQDTVYFGTITPSEKSVDGIVCEQADSSICSLYAKVEIPALNIANVSTIFGFTKGAENLVAESLEGGKLWQTQQPDFFENEKVWYKIGSSNGEQRFFSEAFDYRIIISYQN